MAKQAVIVRYRVKAGRMDEFLAILRDHIAETRASEPGCIQFDILMPHEGKDFVHLHEVYADEDAFRLHNASGQLARYRAQTNSLLDERTVVWCTVAE